MSEDNNFQNPIDPDKITDIPNLIEYPHTVGGSIIKPDDIGKEKGLSLSAMEHQTEMQLSQIYEQMQLLAKQAKQINDRKLISNFVYKSEYKFKPIINHLYHLYQKENSDYILSLIAPNQWGRSGTSFIFLASIRLLADHTWDIVEKSKEFDLINS